MCWKGFCVAVELYVLSQKVVRNRVFTTQITIKIWKGFSQQCGVVVFLNDSLNCLPYSHMLHLFNFSPLYVFKWVLKFLGRYKVALAAYVWLFCLLKCILKLSKLSKLDVTGCDLSPLCVSIVSSNVDEEICIQPGGFCADHPHSLARFVNLSQWWMIWWLRFYTYRWHPTIFV